MRRLWCKWFHKKAHQRIGSAALLYPYTWCWLCEEEVK